MKALIIGGCGFIGSHIVDALLSRGHAVRVLDRKPEQFRAALADVDYRFGDFKDKMALIESIMGVDIIIHSASTTFPGTANLDPKADIVDNLIGAIGILDTMVQLKVGRILFLSSGGTVYGTPDRIPISEDHPLRPIGSYGIVKVAIEQYLEMYRLLHDVSPVVIRASNPYGPRQAHSGVQGVVSTFLKRIHAGLPIEIWGDGGVVRDYLYVTDLAAICAVAAESKIVGVFNAGSGEGHSLNEIIETIRRVTGKTIKIEYKPSRPVDVPRSVLQVSRAEATFAWRCTISLEEGISESWKWLNEQPA